MIAPISAEHIELNCVNLTAAILNSFLLHFLEPFSSLSFLITTVETFKVVTDFVVVKRKLFYAYFFRRLTQFEN